MNNQYEQFRDSRGMTDAEALRYFIREGLEQSEQKAATNITPMKLVVVNLATAGVVIALLGAAGVLDPKPAAIAAAGSLISSFVFAGTIEFVRGVQV